MSHPSVLPDRDSESVRVIGYFPTKLNPSIPDVVLVDRGGVPLLLGRDCSERVCPQEELASAMKVSLTMARDEWLVIDGEPRALHISKIDRWRSQKASELVQSAMGTRGNPLKVLNMLESAAKLRDLDLSGFVTALKTQRSGEDESLGAVFLRVRGSRAGGQTGG